MVQPVTRSALPESGTMFKFQRRKSNYPVRRKILILSQSVELSRGGRKSGAHAHFLIIRASDFMIIEMGKTRGKNEQG